uniref:Uncharacterized protein n=1 Tax=Caenorhabditis japonica TaxID=281687 RepID=A0A8R1EH57_CAEJA
MSRYRLRKTRSNWPMGNDSAHWEPPPIHANELIQSKEQESSSAPADDAPYEGGPLNMAGFMYNPRSRKYYKMTNDPSMPHGFSKADLARMERAREAKFQANRPRFTSGSFLKRPVFKPVATLLDG